MQHQTARLVADEFFDQVGRCGRDRVADVDSYAIERYVEDVFDQVGRCGRYAVVNDDGYAIERYVERQPLL